ncbi:MAG: LapA family protein [Alphaproteobacteria bacterium]|nr:LapA family protein [Alphaproteobacteria bacterium]
MRILAFAAFVIFTAFCIIAAVSNRTDVFFSLHPLPFGWDVPLYMILFAGIFIGLGAGALVMTIKSVKQAHHNRQQIKKIRDLEKQLKEVTTPDLNETIK